MLFCRPQFDSLIKSARWLYLEVTAEAVDSRMSAVKEDVTRSIERRARFTREHLEEQGFDQDYSGAGLENVSKNSSDEDLVKATVKLQMKLFPDHVKEQDGIYGQRTFDTYKQSLTGASLDALRGKIQQARAERMRAEGPKVKHDRIADEITATYHITADVIQSAEEECKTEGNVDQICARKNFVQLADYAGRVTGVPTAAIIAITYAEVGGDFKPDNFGPVDELGMGQFVRKYWDGYRKNPLFVQEMSKFTSQKPATIGRARSMVGDLLAIGIKLKQAERVTGPFDYNTPLNPDQLMAMRFYYHAPGYASVYYGKANRGEAYAASARAAYARYSDRYKTRFADKALEIYEKLKV